MPVDSSWFSKAVIDAEMADALEKPLGARDPLVDAEATDAGVAAATTNRHAPTAIFRDREGNLIALS